MRVSRRFWAMGLTLLLPIAACEGGDSQDEPMEDEGVEMAEPATELSTPGAAGSMSLNTWDTDTDQRLSRDEFDSWYGENDLRSRWGGTADELDRNAFAQGVFETWDVDDDAELTEDEWNEGVAWLGGDHAWEEWDANGDSVLDANEVADAFERENLYDTVDRNSDALIDDEELADWWFDLWDLDDDRTIDTTEWDNVGTEYSRVGWDDASMSGEL